MSGRKVALAKREDFFSDPFFSDLLTEGDDSFQKRISIFKDKGLALSHGQPETAHNLQVSCSNDQFLIQLELPGFSPEDFTLKTRDDVVILEAVHNSEGEVSTSRRYEKEFKMPQGVMRDQLASAYTPEGVLTISAPRVIEAPEGATIAEAMTAGSQAYTTEDGTSVAKDNQASSQMMTATTESPDGTTKSSMSFSSSSSSSSTMMSSSNMGGGPGGSAFPSIRMGGSGDMDSMMQNMMSKMNMGSGFGDSSSLMSKMGSSSNSSIQKSSFSSFSSSSSTVQESSKFGSSGIEGMMNPPVRMQMPSSVGGLNIEELSNAGFDSPAPASQPRYTVTSPPPSAEEMKHSVKGTTGSGKYSTASSEAPDASILLKLKEGNEYKLVLNMQQFSPENIIVKLNDDRELSISAEENNEKFSQKHLVPEGIDLDALTSSFSSDGILVIKAPKKKN